MCRQLMLIWTAPFLVPAVRRWPSRDAFVFGLAFLAAAMAARFAMPLLWPMIGGPQQSLASTLSQPRFIVVAIVSGAARYEGRRAGKAWVSTCRYRCSPVD